ncbi:ribonuclease H1-like isoform X1 [Hylaeus anthracinus]|uniref:ribonuclease H1-like isoform X1 n=1 Tax=Hylaeus anthracinus TaxID=313031 RepID=UPI0023B9B575|nr:ribonuclease H1-like isoform X1 [Hylaeus anthracinus]XP_054008814.1 ribonuclease H1-like isoform X1 [Hylaeus anthracinus]
MNVTRILFKTLRNMAPSFYAVAKGRTPGIYNTWDDCKAQVHQYSGPVYKKFNARAEAEKFIKENSSSSGGSNSNNSTPIVKKRPELKRKPSEVVNTRPSLKRCKLINMQSIPNSGCNQRKASIFMYYNQLISFPKLKKLSDYGMDDEGYVSVYTDGACSSNGHGNAKAGIGVWFGDDHPMNVSQPVVGRATNNMAEIQAVAVAATRAKEAGIKKLKIHTDSQFLIKCINNWMPKWKSNGWKTLANKPVINKIELLEMEEALKSLTVRWVHVNGHVGIHGNEMADKLARAGCVKY